MPKGAGADQTRPREIDLDRAIAIRQLRMFKAVADLNSFRRDWHIVDLGRRKLPASALAFVEFLKDTSWLSRNGSRARTTTD